MAKKNDAMYSLTTRLSPRDLLAVKTLANKNGVTESAYARMLISSSVDVVTTAVPEEELIRLKSATVSRRKHKSVWNRIIDRIKGR